MASHKGQNRWTRLNDELSQRRGIKRARQKAKPADDQPAQLPERKPPAARTRRRHRSR
jgi:hypothetical protein